MSTHASPDAAPVKPARGCPVASGVRAKVSKAALRRMMEVDAMFGNAKRAKNLPEAPESGLRIKVSSNNKRLHDHLLRSGYQYVCRFKMGFRTADWLIYEYAGVGPAQA